MEDITKRMIQIYITNVWTIAKYVKKKIYVKNVLMDIYIL